MYITLETDYAVRIVYCLAKENKRMDAAEISEKTDVTLRFSLKILRKLVGGGLVRSFKGVGGGYELAKPSAEISLKDVLEVIEGPYLLSRCNGSEFDCPRKDSYPCIFHHIFRDISDEVNAKLARYTFEKLSKK